MNSWTIKEALTSIEVRFGHEDIETVSQQYIDILENASANLIALRVASSSPESEHIDELLLAIDAGRQVVQITGARLAKLKQLRGHAPR